MFECVSFFFSKLISLLLAPLYFHFGHTWLFIELCVIFNNLTDTAVFFFVSFFFITFISFYRNYFFQIFNNNLFKNYSNLSNHLPFLTYVNVFFSSFFNAVSFLYNTFYLFFKKKK